MITVARLMNEYFSGKSSQILSESLPGSLPVRPKRSNWSMTQDKKSLLRTFSFKDDAGLRVFMINLLQLQEELNHHGQILINEREVKVKVTTRTLERVTEIDLEYAAHLDKIYSEIAELQENKSGRDTQSE